MALRREGDTPGLDAQRKNAMDALNKIRQAIRGLYYVDSVGYLCWFLSMGTSKFMLATKGRDLEPVSRRINSVCPTALGSKGAAKGNVFLEIRAFSVICLRTRRVTLDGVPVPKSSGAC